MPLQPVHLNQRFKVEPLAANQAFRIYADLHNIANRLVPSYINYRLKGYAACTRTIQRTPFLIQVQLRSVRQFESLT